MKVLTVLVGVGALALGGCIEMAEECTPKSTNPECKETMAAPAPTPVRAAPRATAPRPATAAPVAPAPVAPAPVIPVASPQGEGGDGGASGGGGGGAGGSDGGGGWSGG